MSAKAIIRSFFTIVCQVTISSKAIIRAILTIAWKDILSEFRSRETISSMLIFCLIVVVIFNFMFEPGSTLVLQMVPGILWVAITFA